LRGRRTRIARGSALLLEQLLDVLLDFISPTKRLNWGKALRRIGHAVTIDTVMEILTNVDIWSRHVLAPSRLLSEDTASLRWARVDNLTFAVTWVRIRARHSKTFPTRKLGNNGLTVSAIGFGAMTTCIKLRECGIPDVSYRSKA
jgi:hypothetical protein